MHCEAVCSQCPSGASGIVTPEGYGAFPVEQVAEPVEIFSPVAEPAENGTVGDVQPKAEIEIEPLPQPEDDDPAPELNVPEAADLSTPDPLDTSSVASPQRPWQLQVEAAPSLTDYFHRGSGQQAVIGALPEQPVPLPPVERVPSVDLTTRVQKLQKRQPLAAQQPKVQPEVSQRIEVATPAAPIVKVVPVANPVKRPFANRSVSKKTEPVRVAVEEVVLESLAVAKETKSDASLKLLQNEPVASAAAKLVIKPAAHLRRVSEQSPEASSELTVTKKSDSRVQSQLTIVGPVTVKPTARKSPVRQAPKTRLNFYNSKPSTPLFVR